VQKEEKELEQYIPKDVDDCLVELEKLLINEDYLSIKNGTEEDVLLWHPSLGRYLRNTWGLWQESRLAKWFNKKGINHPDEMSHIVLVAFWRDINSEFINLEELIEEYKDGG